jgi:hypothetical protein
MHPVHPFLIYSRKIHSNTISHLHLGFPSDLFPSGFGPKREEDGSWRKLHNDELCSLYSSPNIVRVIKPRRMRWAGHVARMGQVFTLGRPRRGREDNIELDLREIGIDGANWMWLAQDKVQWRDFVSTVMNLRVP